MCQKTVPTKNVFNKSFPVLCRFYCITGKCSGIFKMSNIFTFLQLLCSKRNLYSNARCMLYIRIARSSVLVKQWKWVIFLDKWGRFVQALIVLRGSLMTLTNSTHKGSGRCLLWQSRYKWRQFISKYSHASNAQARISLSKEKLSYAQTLMFKLKRVLLWTILKKFPHVKKPSDLREKAAHFC
jgi:hypothetical protein